MLSKNVLVNAGNDGKFSNNNYSKVASWLNSTFKTGGYLPSEITDNIDNTVAWCNEASYWWGRNEQLSNLGIGLMSINEIMENCAKIGLADSAISWWTRSPSIAGTDGDITHVVNAVSNIGSTIDAKYQYQNYGIRPMFYLNEKFFTNVKIDLASAGANVKTAIRKNYTRAELLAAGYTEDELSVYYDETGTIGSVSVAAPSVLAGSTLTASCEFDGISAAADKVSYAWQISDTADGKYLFVGDANSSTIVSTAEMDQKYLRAVAYTPNGDGVAYSQPVFMDVFKAEFDGVITSNELKGIFKAGNTLHYTYVGTNVTDENITAYEWSRSTSAAGTFTAVTGDAAAYATADTETVYYYKAKVTLVNGDTYETAPVCVAGRSAKQNGSFSPTNAQADTNYDYVFTVNGQNFILLDTVATSDTARYMVLAENTYGKYTFSKANLAAAGELLPAAIKNHIDSTVFFSGSKNAWGGYLAGFTNTVCVPSCEEINAYSSIIGLAATNLTDVNTLENPLPVEWYLRNNAASTSDGDWRYSIVGSTLGAGRGKDAKEIRPLFYLDKDFFTAEAANIEAIGTAAQAMIN